MSSERVITLDMLPDADDLGQAIREAIMDVADGPDLTAWHYKQVAEAVLEFVQQQAASCADFRMREGC